MELNRTSVTREYEWTVKAIPNGFVVSEQFEIALFENNIKCQFIVFFAQEKLWIHLHKIEVVSDEFVADLKVTLAQTVNSSVKRQSLNGKIFQLRCSWIVFDLKDFFNQCKTCDKFIKLDIKLVFKEKKPEAVEYLGVTKLLSNYGKLFNSQMLSDFKFICSDKKEVPAHRFVLIAHSPVMYKMLTTPMMESKTSSAKLDDIDGDTMLEVLRFLYTGQVEDIEDVAPNLLYCADKYELTELKSFVASAMADNLTTDNVLEYFSLAERYGEDNLLGKCIFYIKQNYKAIQKRDKWTTFNPKMKTIIKMFMSDEDKHQVRVLKVQTAPIVFTDLAYQCMRLNVQNSTTAAGYLYKLT